jgi:hypothetical protein
MCTGAVTTLADGVTGGVWSSSNSFVGAVTDSTGILTTGAPDTVQIRYTVAAAGRGCSVTKTITVDPLPIPVITFSGVATHTLSTYPFYTSYQWYDSTTGLIPGANGTSLVIVANVSKYYYVVVTDINGCTGVYGYNFISHAGVGTIAGNEISIYPNPATDKVIITSAQSVKAVITDVTGRKAIEQDNATEVNVSGLAPGVYAITLYDANGLPVAKEKLVKQ